MDQRKEMNYVLLIIAFAIFTLGYMLGKASCDDRIPTEEEMIELNTHYYPYE
jgi:hypothetical protein